MKYNLNHETSKKDFDENKEEIFRHMAIQLVQEIPFEDLQKIFWFSHRDPETTSPGKHEALLFKDLSEKNRVQVSAFVPVPGVKY